MISVLVVDDQRVVRDGLTMLVGLIDGVEVLGAASDGAEAVALAQEKRPDVVLMDLRMPGTDGVSATTQLKELLPEIRVLVLTTYADEASIMPALRAGAAGYLTKDASAEEIESAIRAVHAGQTHLDPAVQRQLVAAMVAQPATPTGPTEVLTAREAEVLTLIATGLSNTEIGAKLVLSNATVKTHINRIFAKIGARDRAQAIRYAYEKGLAIPPAAK
jgi:DNA-binding NarL/FixJ family response regulator